jgi:hypothetical protein
MHPAIRQFLFFTTTTTTYDQQLMRNTCYLPLSVGNTKKETPFTNWILNWLLEIVTPLNSGQERYAYETG